MATMESVMSELTNIHKELKALAKIVRKIRATQEDPTGEKKEERTKNNGFNKLLNISPQLREFLGLPEGERISRSDVTKTVNKYVKDKGLKHPDNGRVLILDDKLKKLLNPPADVTVTYLNLQKYISPHYLKD